jgi:urease accessory protein
MGKLIVTALGAMLPVAAYAHPGLGPHAHFTPADALLAGLLHPFTGVDHLLALSAVGLWAARYGRAAAIRIGTVTLISIIAGALVAIGGLALPMIESAIALSLFVMGLLVACGNRISLRAGIAYVAVLGVVHGYAHGSEMLWPGALSNLAGMTLASCALIMIGYGLGHAQRLSSSLSARSRNSVSRGKRPGAPAQCP